MYKSYGLTQLVSKLRIKVTEPRQMATPEGPMGRLKRLRATVTALVRHERLELNYHRADEARGYAERLISDAIRYGDKHKPTMDLAKFWMEDPVLVPKLFKVLVPRYKSFSHGLPYTRMLRAPSNPTELKDYAIYKRTVLELRNNPYPPLPGPFVRPNPGSIHNVLLEEARKDYYKSQNKITSNDKNSRVTPELHTPIDGLDVDSSKIIVANIPSQSPIEEDKSDSSLQQKKT